MNYSSRYWAAESKNWAGLVSTPPVEWQSTLEPDKAPDENCVGSWHTRQCSNVIDSHIGIIVCCFRRVSTRLLSSLLSAYEDDSGLVQSFKVSCRLDRNSENRICIRMHFEGSRKCYGFRDHRKLTWLVRLHRDQRPFNAKLELQAPSKQSQH